MLANLKDVLVPARKGGYAVGLFNTVNLELARGVLEAAQELRSPVIIGTAEILLPAGPLEELSYLLLGMAEKASVPVVLHLDHGLSFETCEKALALGFTSVMYDCSADSYEENVRKVKEMAQLAHEKGATIEAELGHVGDNTGAAGSCSGSNPQDYYTEPEQARAFVESTHVDALAIAVGTAHGAYKFPPRLDFERIEAIARLTDAFLVLHGGSGLSDADFKEAVRRGISKINIFTDINQAGVKAAYDNYRPGTGLTDVIPYEVEAIKRAVKEKLEVFGSQDKYPQGK